MRIIDRNTIAMKTFLKTTALVFLSALLSCGKDNDSAEEKSDESDEVVGKSDEMVEKLENTPLDAEAVSNNVKIKGASIVKGELPKHIGKIPLDLSNSSKVALINKGFVLKLISGRNVRGAYLQFKDKDGIVASSYYDINISENATSNKSENTNSVLSNKSKTLYIGFNDKIHAGTFCYNICVYSGTAENPKKISKPQQGCITVENWGGYSAIVGVWNAIKNEETKNEVTTITTIGKKEIYNKSSNINCKNGQEKEVIYKWYDVIKDDALVINADGIYNEVLKKENQHLDYNASVKSCSAMTKTVIYTNKHKGNWAYVVADNRLILVESEYSSERSDSEVIGSRIYEPKETKLVYDESTIFQLDGNSLIITKDDGNGYKEITYYKKK